jgi:hypothetical protein
MVAIARPHASGGDRASIVALGLVVAAFVATLASPLWLLLLAPLVLGAPHIVADLRYLVLHGPRRLRPGAIIAVSVPLAAMIALRTGALAGSAVMPRLEVGLGCGAAAGAALSARRSPAVIAALIAAAVPALAAPRVAMLVLLHGHNVVAFVIWLRWTRGGPARAPLVVIAVAGAALIGLGAFDALLPRGGPLDADALARAFAPGLGAIAGGRVVLLYAFAQALTTTRCGCLSSRGRVARRHRCSRTSGPSGAP